ncbi:MAG: methyltransferase domain-containing protein [Hyphomicrobiales bacterium]
MEFAVLHDYVSSVTSSVPQLFDAARIRHNFGRAKDGPLRFLAETAASHVMDRFELIPGDFALSIVHGLGAETVRGRLLASRRFERIFAAAPSPGTGDELAFDTELLPFADKSLDALVSILALHFANDLPGALIQMRRALKPKGVLLASLFGGSSLAELRESWLQAEGELCGGVTPRVAPFADIRELGALLQRAGFAEPVADADRVTVRYSGPHALMREIKSLGLSSALQARSRRPVTPKLLARAAQIYEERFSDPDGRVRATIEVVWLTARAPEPGESRSPTSTRRLADPFGTGESAPPPGISER